MDVDKVLLATHYKGNDRSNLVASSHDGLLTAEQASEVASWTPGKLDDEQLQQLDASYGRWIQHLHVLVPGIFIAQFRLFQHHPEVLQALNIGTIINLANEYNYTVPAGIEQYTFVGCKDTQTADWAPWLEKFSHVFIRALRRKRGIVIHCHAGKHRAPSYIVAMLMAAGVQAQRGQYYRLREILRYVDYVNHVCFACLDIYFVHVMILLVHTQALRQKKYLEKCEVNPEWFTCFDRLEKTWFAKYSRPTLTDRYKDSIPTDRPIPEDLQLELRAAMDAFRRDVSPNMQVCYYYCYYCL